MLISKVKYSILLFLFIFMGVTTRSQNISGLNIGVEFGASRFIFEAPSDFSKKIIEFDNKFGFTTDAEISKYFSEHWEIGIEINYATLNGESQNTSFSAIGHHHALKDLENMPVEYNNRLVGQKVFSRFYVIPLNTIYKKVNGYPFFSAGVGILNYKSKFKYIDAAPNDIIFGKGYEGFTKLSTAVYSLGGGLKISWSSKLFILTSINYNFVNYGFLDVMHNYDDKGNKMDIVGMYSDFKVGIFYSLTPLKVSKKRSSDKKNSRSKKGRKKQKSKKDNYLPFAR